MNLLAKSCFAPGLITLISNLIASSGDQTNKNLPEEWLKEYVDGMGSEIYRVQISEMDYQNDDHKNKYLSFLKIVDIVYNEYASVVFALEIEAK